MHAEKVALRRAIPKGPRENSDIIYLIAHVPLIGQCAYMHALQLLLFMSTFIQQLICNNSTSVDMYEEMKDKRVFCLINLILSSPLKPVV